MNNELWISTKISTFAPAFAHNMVKMLLRTISHYSFLINHLAEHFGPFVYRLGREIFIL